jgi:hypothetical protein
MKVTVNIPTAAIVAKMGLGQSDTARKALAVSVRRRSDKYVPLDTGTLKNNAQVSSDGRSITYLEPYAAPQYTKNYHHTDPNRGPYWDQRMLANEKGQLVAEFENYLKGTLK